MPELDLSQSKIAQAYAIARKHEAERGWHQTKAAPIHSLVSISENILAALEQARDSRKLIEPAQAELRELYENAGSDSERNARSYQIDLLGWQLNRAADLAEARLDYLPKIRTKGDAEAENTRCAADAVHWFNYYAWGIDPRPDAPLSLMPFGLFPFQEQYVAWLDKITFKLRKSGVTEKCRDMGATETFLRWMWRHWRYTPGFIGMVLSANEDLVDSKKDPSTLFEKLRFQTRLIPQWMLPNGFDLNRDLPYMLMQNPDNGSIILGDAPTANVGRQRRATVVLGDEYAAWAHGGYPQYTALSRTTNTFCPVSSVQGKFNKFYDLAHDGHTEVFTMDWQDHPWRDQRWFDALPFGYIGAAMTSEEIAQEVERNYDASQPGKVLKNVREEYCFINWQEFIDGYAKLGYDQRLFHSEPGQPKIPDLWNWGRVTDYGESARTENDTHIWAYSLCARPQEDDPLEDSLFFFYSLPIMPIGATELEGYAFYSELERQLGLRNTEGFTRKPKINDMSHEATDPKEVLKKQCGDSWRVPDLDFNKGRRKMVFHFEIVDKHLPNPFRPVLMGRCRIYFVALPHLDGTQEYFLAPNERNGGYFVTASTTQKGFKRLRQEISAWHYPVEERGKPVPKMRPEAKFDDIITTVRYMLARWGVDPQELDKEQKYRKHLQQTAPELLPENIEKHPDEMAQSRLLQAALMNRQNWQKAQEDRTYENNDYNKFIRRDGEPVPDNDYREL